MESEKESHPGSWCSPLRLINISWKHKIETIRNSQKEKISYLYMDIKYVNTVEFAFFHTGSKHALQVFPVVCQFY